MLLVDYFDFDSLQVLEENKSNGTMKLRGICQRAGAPNKNNRIYEKTLLEREFKKLSPLIIERRLIGELDHPTGPTISLKNSSHIVTEVYFNGDDAMCVVELLNTPAGKVAQSLIKDGVKLGISSRAVGSLDAADNKGVQKVNEDLKLITWDLVADPSTKEAFVGINESVSADETEPIKRKISNIIRERLVIETFRRKFLVEDSRADIERDIERIYTGHTSKLKGKAKRSRKELDTMAAGQQRSRTHTRTRKEKALEAKLGRAAGSRVKKRKGEEEQNSSLTITGVSLLKEYLDSKKGCKVVSSKKKD